MKQLPFFILAALLCTSTTKNDVQIIEKSNIDTVARRIEVAHQEIWRRFVDPYHIMVDYADYSGGFPRPTAEEFRASKPNALGWWTPTENGSMFNGIYMDGIYQRWLFTKSAKDKRKAKILAEGLLFLSSVGDTPGFIARGVATDGKTVPPMGSDDQTSPWFYGLWRYASSDMCAPGEKAKIIEKMTMVANVLLSTKWRLPAASYSPSPFRGGFGSFHWEGTTRMLFVLKALHALTGDDKWNQLYLTAIKEQGGTENLTRLQVCSKGMFFKADNKLNRWTGLTGTLALRGLWEMEKDLEMREAYAAGLNSSAISAAEGLHLWKKFDSYGEPTFLADWRKLNEWWKPQHSQQEAVDVARKQSVELTKLSPRRTQELAYMREPIWMALIIAASPDKKIVMAHKEEMLAMLGHFKYERLYYSQFFPAESIWFRLKKY